jgi:hypothetical protein
MTSPAAPQPNPVSARQLAKATAAAAAIAVTLLVVAVLPAEYGIDPLGTGAALGLIRGAAPSVDTAGPLASTDLATLKIDYAEFVLAPYDYVEYKYRLAQSGTMVYSWDATAPVIHDFHGAPDTGGTEAEVSLDKQSKSRAAGSLTAAFPGMHGWYWENPGGTPITIRVRSAGFYSAAVEYRSNRTRRVHELSAPGGAPDAASKGR